MLGGEPGRLTVSTAPPDGDHAGRPAGLRQDDAWPASWRSSSAQERQAPAAGRGRHRIARPPSSQLQTLGKQIDIPVYARAARSRPRSARKPRVEHARSRTATTIVILDTAGRLHIDETLMEELEHDQGGRPADRDAAGRRRDDRPGGGAGRRGRSTSASAHRGDPDQDRRRCARRRGALDPRGHRRADQVPRHRREARRARAVPPRPAGLAHPRHGRRADADRARPGGVRPGARQEKLQKKLAEGDLRPRRLPEPAPAAQAMGPLEQACST